MEQVKVVLQDREIPKKWYNIMADLPTPMRPPLHPGTGKPVTPKDLAAIFPMNIIAQEASGKRWIKIPDEVLQKYLLWRPSPLYRAYNFEKLLNCPVKIYYKNEGVSPAGSHKPNAAVPMAYFNKDGRNKKNGYGNRSRTVGQRIVHGNSNVRFGVPRLHGKNKL